MSSKKKKNNNIPKNRLIKKTFRRFDKLKEIPAVKNNQFYVEGKQ